MKNTPNIKWSSVFGIGFGLVAVSIVWVLVGLAVFQIPLFK